MSIESILKKNLFWLILTTTLGYPFTTDQRNTQLERVPEISITNIGESIKLKELSRKSWKDIAEYEAFVRSTVDKYYVSDISDIYSFFNIKRDLPKYGFKPNPNAFNCRDCQGAVYKINEDSIYFYTGCPEELFIRYLKFSEKYIENPRAELEKRIRYSIKHEAGHAFYYNLAKELGETYLFNVNYNKKSTLYNIQHSIVEEGVAEYIAHKGELTESAKTLSNEDFKKMVKEKNDTYLYDLGFKLVKSLLDLDFQEGVKEFIMNPLTKEDLNDFPAYSYRMWGNYMIRISHGMWKPPRG